MTDRPERKILIIAGPNDAGKPKAPAVPRERDPDLVNAEIALQRAALRAREKAWRHGVPVVYSEDGVIKYEYPPATNEASDEHAST